MFAQSRIAVAFLLIAMIVVASAVPVENEESEQSRVKRQFFGGYPFFGGYGYRPWGYGGYGGGWGMNRGFGYGGWGRPWGMWG